MTLRPWRKLRTAESRRTGGPTLLIFDVVVELELLAPVEGPATMPLSWDLTARWFASFGGADQRQPEQRRNR